MNPTVVVSAGATITVRFADADAGHPHGFEDTTATPRDDGRTGGGARRVHHASPRPHGASWYGATATFRAPSAGTYYYLCPVPGHAQQGMWGKLIVR